MAQYGLQPNGMVRLQDGTMWNPNDPLPPERASAFNATPMGNPLAPSTSVPIGAPPAAAPAPTPSSPPMRMFGRGITPSPALSDSSAMQPSDMPSVMSGWPNGFGSPVVSMNQAPPVVRDGPPTFSLPGSPRQLAEMPGGAYSADPSAAASPSLPSGMFGAKPKFFAPGGTGREIAGAVGNAMLAFGNPQLAATVFTNQQRDRDAQTQAAMEMQKYRLGLSTPTVEKVGNDLVVYRKDGQGGTQTLYHGPSEAEAYAATIGLQPGTDAFKKAVQDYALKDAGPTALGARQANWDADNARGDAQLAEERRYHDASIANDRSRIGLEGQRVGLEGQRVGMERGNQTTVTPTKVIGPILAKVAAGQALTPAEQRAFSMYRTIDPMNQVISQAIAAGGGSIPGAGTPMPSPAQAVPAPVTNRSSRFRVGQTITGPGGAKRQWNGSAWVPLNG